MCRPWLKKKSGTGDPTLITLQITYPRLLSKGLRTRKFYKYLQWVNIKVTSSPHPNVSYLTYLIAHNTKKWNFNLIASSSAQMNLLIRMRSNWELFCSLGWQGWNCGMSKCNQTLYLPFFVALYLILTTWQFLRWEIDMLISSPT